MKRIFLLIVTMFIIAILAIESKAQCPTCREGQHYSSYNLPPNGNHTFGQSYILQNVCGLNYTTASVLIETRSKPFAFNANGSGFPAPLTISALCGVATPQKSYVYYDASYTEASAPATTVTIKNPIGATNTYPSVLIGTDGPKCWGETGTACYRCDVTAAISGNGTYNIQSINGFANAAWEVDGATLIIVYTTAAAYSGSIVLWDGCITTFGTFTYTGTGFSACAASPIAQAFSMYGDMQINVNAGINNETYNGTSASFPNTFWNFDLINTALINAQNTLVFNSYTNNSGDCWTWVAAGLYWQNTNCLPCATSCVLPIQLEYFKCELQKDNTVMAYWATGSEDNNKSFDLQRSDDGINWYSTSEVPGAGNSDYEIKYSTNDENPVMGTTYYRLKQTDFDGNYTTSNVVSVSDSNIGVSVFPNPTKGGIIVLFKKKYDYIVILDMSGKIVYAKNTNELNSCLLDLSFLKSGMYILQAGDHYIKFNKE